MGGSLTLMPSSLEAHLPDAGKQGQFDLTWDAPCNRVAAKHLLYLTLAGGE